MPRRATTSDASTGSSAGLGVIDVDSRHFLGRNAVSEKVNSNYCRIRGYFWTWVVWRDLDPFVSFEELDTYIEQYMEFIYAHGWPTYRALQLLDAMKHHNPRLKGKLPRSHRRVAQGLRKLHITEHHTPVPMEVVWAIAVVLTRTGKIREAVAILLAFHCYLRISEVARLKKVCVVLRGDHRILSAGSCASITLENTKTGPDQFVLIKNTMMEELLKRTLEESSENHELVFGEMTVKSLRAIVKEGQLLIGLTKQEFYNFHGLRGGGCGNDVFREIYTLPQIKLRGRWVSAKSFQIYSRRCRAMLAKGGLPKGDALLMTLISRLTPEMVFGGLGFVEGVSHEL
jgi:hypothetical protein